MTAEDYAILKLLEEAMNARDAEAFCALWRRFADWHGLHPDFAVVLQQYQAMNAAGFTAADRVKAIVAERLASKSVH